VPQLVIIFQLLFIIVDKRDSKNRKENEDKAAASMGWTESGGESVVMWGLGKNLILILNHHF
jgi:hypothetical protein